MEPQCILLPKQDFRIGHFSRDYNKVGDALVRFRVGKLRT